MYKKEGLCPRRDKKKRKTRKVNCIQKLNKKKRGEGTESEARYRPRSAPDRRNRTLGLHLVSQKKKAKFKIEKEVARRTRTQM
jgi:hypothetical protein